MTSNPDPEVVRLIDEYLSGHPDGTAKSYRLRLMQFVRWCQAAGHDPLEPTPATFNGFVRDAKEGQGQRVATVKQASSALRGFYAYLVSTGRRDVDPTRHPAVKLVTARTEPGMPKTLSLDEARAMLKAAGSLNDVRYRIAVGLLLLGGLAPREITSARVADVTRTADGGLLLSLPTRRSSEPVPLVGDLADAVSRHIAGRPPSGSLVLNQRNNPVNVTNLRSAVEKAASLAGLTTTPSMTQVRQTGAVLLLQHGGSGSDLVRYLGVLDTRDTGKYFAAAARHATGPHPAQVLGSLLASTRYPALDQADRLLRDPSIHPAAAAALAGAAVEARLRELCAAIDSAPSGIPKDWTIAKLVAAYGAKKKLSRDDRSDLDRIAAVRNDAAHGWFDEVTLTRAREASRLARRFLAKTESELAS